jgi:hypothetical protein
VLAGKERVKELEFPRAASETCCTKDAGREALIAGVEMTHSVRRTAMMKGTLRRTQRLRQGAVLLLEDRFKIGILLLSGSAAIRIRHKVYSTVFGLVSEAISVFSGDNEPYYRCDIHLSQLRHCEGVV